MHSAIPNELATSILILFPAVSGGLIFLFWRIVQGLIKSNEKLEDEVVKLRADMAKFREDALLSCQRCSEKFRTNDQADKDWHNLEIVMTKQEVTQKERYDNIMQKINNQTALFMQEKSFLDKGICEIRDRVTKIEIKAVKNE